MFHEAGFGYQRVAFFGSCTIILKWMVSIRMFRHMDVSENSGFPPKSSILIGFSFINHPFWGTPTFRKHPYDNGKNIRWKEIGDFPMPCYFSGRYTPMGTKWRYPVLDGTFESMMFRLSTRAWWAKISKNHVRSQELRSPESPSSQPTKFNPSQNMLLSGGKLT